MNKLLPPKGRNEGNLGTVARSIEGNLLARGTVLNGLGQALPLLTALICIPSLVNGLGADRYGVLALAGAIIGYFSLFDLGLGRALTQFVAYRLGQNDTKDLPAAIWTAVFLMFGLGVLGGVILAAIAGWLTYSVLNLPIPLRSEVHSAIVLISLGVPAITVSAGFRGVLEAHQRFGLINLIRIPLGVFSFAGPVGILAFSNRLESVMVVLITGLYVASICFASCAMRAFPGLRFQFAILPHLLPRLLKFGAWMTVSNVVGPLMTYLDRFLIGALLTVSAVTYYTTSYDTVTRLWIIPAAMTPVLFPAFATVSSTEHDRAIRLFTGAIRVVFVMLLPLVVIVVALAHDALNLWLGADFADRSTEVLQILAVGVLINSMAHIAFALVQGFGKADWTAKMHAAELPFYLVAVWWLTDQYGIVGTAIAWSSRVTADAGILFVMSQRLLGAGRVQVSKRWIVASALTMIAILGATLCSNFQARIVYVLVTLFIFSIMAWRHMLLPEERNFVLSFWTKRCLRKNGI